MQGDDVFDPLSSLKGGALSSATQWQHAATLKSSQAFMLAMTVSIPKSLAMLFTYHGGRCMEPAAMTGCIWLHYIALPYLCFWVQPTMTMERPPHVTLIHIVISHPNVESERDS